MAIRPISDAVAERAAASIHQPRDPNTLSNYNAWRTQKTTADFTIDFAAKRLKGHVSHTLARLAKGETKIVLDTSFLAISGVEVGGSKASFELASSRSEPYGSPLTIQVDEKHAGAEQLEVRIAVETTKDCTALQWMTPEQTSNKKHPYMFSQCQAIHARSLFPCQDTPDVKAQYTFNMRSPLPVLASGLPTGARDFEPGTHGAPGTLLYTFHQSIPMPSYLFALASGDLASASIGPRSTVWTGPEELRACQWEFEKDTEAFIQAAEKIVYPYAWTTYNVLVLPPSFPYGGWRIPCKPPSLEEAPSHWKKADGIDDNSYTFATPTLISGDRQNVDVIAHELSHSWSGNLVSAASWEHFWLNEGWTQYLERRLQIAIHGGDERHRDFSAIIGWKALTDSIQNFGADHEFTKLIPDLRGKDPDDAFSSVPYEKGFTFLYYLEKLVGRGKWDTFIPHYFTEFKEKSVDSYEFKATLLSFFEPDAEASAKLAAVDWDTWFYAPGFPPKPDFDTTLADQCYALAEKWRALNEKGGSASFTPSEKDIQDLTSNQVVVFLESLQSLPQPLSADLAVRLGEVYKLADSANIELASRYYVIGLKARAKALYKPAADLLGRVGRMKFVRPVFGELLRCDSGLAKGVLKENGAFYHPICRGMMEKMVEKFDRGTEGGAVRKLEKSRLRGLPVTSHPT